MYVSQISKGHLLSMNKKYLNGYTKRRYTKYKLLLTSSDISALLRESRFQTNVNITIC